MSFSPVFLASAGKLFLRRRSIVVLGALLLAACATQPPASREVSEQGRRGPAPESSQGKNLESQIRGEEDLLTVNSILVLPVEFDTQARSFQSDRKRFDSRLETAARAELAVQVIAGQKVAEHLQRTGSSAGQNIAASGKSFNADAVLTTTINTFTERQGTRFAADKGAGVDFTMALYRVRDGKAVWTANYHFKDQALTDNILNIRDRFGSGGSAGWQDADQVLEKGFASAFADFSQRRLGQFSAQLRPVEVQPARQ